ncbi:type IV secretory system conjugative DNA transfer family protein [Saccharothrix saharensis]|uniref:type IV secretory system conjugative DNA transfer family protein n=1 Tax=Saccharothrix saharensis TaxID=571190 RepID=UPI00367918A8
MVIPGRHRTTLEQRRRRAAGLLLALVGAVAAVWLATGLLGMVDGQGWYPPRLQLHSPTGGDGGLLDLPTYRPPSSTTIPDQAAPSTRSTPIPEPTASPDATGSRWPVTVQWPVRPLWAFMAALPLWAAWLALVVAPVAGYRREGLASTREVRRTLGRRQARRKGRVTWPRSRWWTRLTMPTTAFGYRLGRPLRPWAPWVPLWAHFEHNIRILGRTGWGKTLRLLIPIIRDLPGAAMVLSIEPAVFTHTVLARQHRPARPVRAPVSWLPRHRRTREYPVAAVDFSDPAERFTAGFSQVRWNPINGCGDFTVATRRAHALVAGSDTVGIQRRGSEDDMFFRNSAAEVLAAWLYAAALGGYGLDEIAQWLSDTQHTTPRRVLAEHPNVDRTALLALTTHLSTRSDRTTSGVERYLALTINALISREGRAFCDVHPDRSFNMVEFVRGGGTVYVLADPDRVHRVRPLLSLFTAEMFIAARTVALAHPGGRLPVPFVAVLDELRHSVVVPNLPYIGNTMRKHGIHYLYSVQSSSQEDELYGAQADGLRASASVTVVGGLDMTVAPELTTRAGNAALVERARERGGDQVTRVDSLPVSEQQRLADGRAVIAPRGSGLFIASAPTIHQRRRLRRRIHREVAVVDAIVREARSREYSRARASMDAADARATFNHPGGTQP